MYEKFGMPFTEAALQLGVGVQQLAQVCESFGIKIWPERRLQELEGQISANTGRLKTLPPKEQGRVKDELTGAVHGGEPRCAITVRALSWTQLSRRG